MNQAIEKPQTKQVATRDPKSIFMDPKVMEGLKLVQSKWVPADRMVKVAIATISQDPKLQQCTTSSLIRAVLIASLHGLEPTGAVGGGYLVPRFNSKIGVMEAHFQSDYRGEIQRVRRSMATKNVVAAVVREADVFQYIPSDLDSPILHKIADGDRGDRTHVWAIIRLQDGSLYHSVLTKQEVEDEHRAHSDGAFRKDGADNLNSPWFAHTDEMWKKSALRAAVKYAPKGGELTVDEEAPSLTLDAVFASTASVPQLEAGGSKADRVAKRMRAASTEGSQESVVVLDEGVEPTHGLVA